MAAPALAGGLGLHGVQAAADQKLPGVHVQVSASNPSSFTAVPAPVPFRPPKIVMPVADDAPAVNSRTLGPVPPVAHDQVLAVVL